MGQRAAAFPASVRMGFVLDVTGYGGRSAREKVDVQHRVAALVDEVLRDLGLCIDDTHHHGTGDGMVVFLPSDVEVPRALARLLRSAAEMLAEDNRRYRDRMRLRMAAVIGPLGPAAIGFSGAAIVEAGRLVDSEALRRALAERPHADLAVVVSEQLYAHALAERRAGLSTEEFQPVEVHAKEFRGRAWLWNGPAAPGPAAEPVFRALRPDGCVLGVRPGRIMRVRDVDIWVNSENTEMEMPRFNEFSISAIIRYNGARRDAGGHVVEDVIADELARAVGAHRPVAPGTAFVTGPGALADSNAVRWIIHVAAVHGEPGAGFRQIRHVGACVASALAHAERLAADDEAVRTIIFPMLGTGQAGGSVAATAVELVAAAVDHLAATPSTRLRGVYFLGYTEQEKTALTDALAAHPALRPAP
ncbi:macro domain-containing protein [Dactylosporangium sp. CA-233914]|uniref:macro domain-containing protein n=1 Tax=Dactylosporangium sp. CA-233914 TaxID=3239934 RepID=UPI003D8C55D5